MQTTITFPDTEDYAVWKHGHHGSNLYWQVHIVESFADAAKQNSCLCKINPKKQETIVQTTVIPQKKEQSIYDDDEKFDVYDEHNYTKISKNNWSSTKRRGANKKKGNPYKKDRIINNDCNNDDVYSSLYDEYPYVEYYMDNIPYDEWSDWDEGSIWDEWSD